MVLVFGKRIKNFKDQKMLSLAVIHLHDSGNLPQNFTFKIFFKQSLKVVREVKKSLKVKYWLGAGH